MPVHDDQVPHSGSRWAPEPTCDSVLGKDGELSGWRRTQQTRRRVLIAQLERLAARVGDTDLVARDAADRARRLAARLDRDDLEW